MHESSAEKLREKIKELKKELETVTFEKGLAAEDNKDLRENSAYDYWDQKESILIIRIHKIMREISEIYKKPYAKKVAKKQTRPVVKKLTETFPHKWL
jgi:transcription elongation GreA/GreB family factor